MFERHNEPLISRTAFLKRQLLYLIMALGIDAGSLAIGMVGYHVFEGYSWIDSLLNASMLLGGMGQVNELHTNAGKLFASFYAIYCGVIFLVVAAVILTPGIHRLMHHFHLETDERD